MPTTISTASIVISGSSPTLTLTGSEGSADPCALRENAGNLELYDVSATAATKKTSVLTGRRISPLINCTELYLKAITAHGDDTTLFSAAQMYGGIISFATVSTGRSCATDSAANIITYIGTTVPGVCATGTWFEFTIINNGANTVTVTAGSSVTLSGLMTVPTTISGSFLLIVTGGSTVSIYRK